MPLFLRNFTKSKFTISLVLSLAGVAGCIVPPIVGYLSDRSLTRFGRVMGIGYAYLLDLIPRDRTAEFLGLLS
jgi:predicted MFS family arabinose efflux permease